MEQNQVIPVDTSRAQYMLTLAAQPKIGDRKTGTQKVDPRSGLPMWVTQLTAISTDGARVLQVTTVSPTPPTVSVGETVVPVGLEALPWSNEDREGKVRFGIAYRAQELRPVTVSAAA